MVSKFYIPPYNHGDLHTEPSRPSAALGVLIETGKNLKLADHYAYLYVFSFPQKIITGENVLLSGSEAVQTLQDSAPFLYLTWIGQAKG